LVLIRSLLNRFLSALLCSSKIKKPGNIFLDIENGSGSVSVRLGDFGLATTNRQRNADELDKIYSTPDGSDMLDGSITRNSLDGVSGGESMTGGVGTTFYRAPEQEGKIAAVGGSRSYTVQADIFSFGIIFFEMFHAPIPTYMERAEILTKLRGERRTPNSESFNKDAGFDKLASSRFPEAFTQSVPENIQR
jgi:serine/threonine protein kinase